MSLANLSIKRPIFITCVVLLMIIIGLISFYHLPVDNMPDTTFPTVSVTVTYSGAGPQEVETLITKPLEDQIATVSGLKRLSSTSLEGVAQVTAEFNFETEFLLYWPHSMNPLLLHSRLCWPCLLPCAEFLWRSIFQVRP